jgi:tetratricopeptide (TPR) repeat protein
LLAVLARNPDRMTTAERQGADVLLLSARQQAQVAGNAEPRLLLQEARLAQMLGRFDSAAQGFQQALRPVDWLHPLTREERWCAMGDWAGLLKQQGKEAESHRVSVALKAERWLAGCVPRDPLQARALALDLVLAGHLDEAEQVYRKLLQMQFQPLGTLTHLVRVFLLQERLVEAGQAATHARWLLRHEKTLSETSAYVAARVLFLGILFGLLRGRDVRHGVARLKRALAEQLERVEWTILPALSMVERRLSPDDYAFLRALVEAMNQRESPEVLRVHWRWRDAAQLPSSQNSSGRVEQ